MLARLGLLVIFIGLVEGPHRLHGKPAQQHRGHAERHFGGVGTIAGALLGALVMQSLQSGMVLMGLDSPLQSIVVGAVLVFAVWLDTLYRRNKH